MIENHIDSGKAIAYFTFSIGTIIFLIFYFSGLDEIIGLIFYLVMFLALINIIKVISLIILAIRDSFNRKRIVRTILFMLINIPISITYIWVAIILLNIIRIELCNNTRFAAKDIHINGCANYYLEKLAPRKHKTVWLWIIGEGSVDINYIIKGKRKSENIIGYTCPNLGGRVTYIILE